MPLPYKIAGYLGNAALFALCLIMLLSGGVGVGLALGALSAFNIFIVYKLDKFSQPEAWLAHQLEMSKLREELLASQKRLAAAPGAAAQNAKS